MGNPPGSAGEIRFDVNRRSASALIRGSRLRVKDHVFSLVPVNRDTGRAFPLYYTGRTKVVAGPEGAVKKVRVDYKREEVEEEVTVYLMVDTYPAASATVIL